MTAVLKYIIPKEIPLTRGKVALVDDEDYESLMKHKWNAHKSISAKGIVSWYAVRTQWAGICLRVDIKMHRQIRGVPPGDPRLVDHADGDGLNNQKRNLRVCNFTQNVVNRRKFGTNKSKYKGVTNHAATGKWRARIGHGDKCIYLGLFKDEVDAAQAYNFAAEELHGEFARFNTPDGVQ